jgi:transcriptional regulator with XRE-family HTH domain
MATILSLIHLRIEALGWSQSDLARATNIPRQNLSPMLRGERPLRIQHLLLIDHALGLGLDYGQYRWNERNGAGNDDDAADRG